MKMIFRKTWLSKTGCHGHVKVGDHVIQGKNISRRVLGKVLKFGGDSFNRHEVIHLQRWRGPQKPFPGLLNRVKEKHRQFLDNFALYACFLVKLRVHNTCVFRICINCPFRFVTRVISANSEYTSDIIP